MKNQNLYRTQVLLEPAQYRQLVDLAEKDGISLSAFLRRLIAHALDERQRLELARAAEKMMDLYYSDDEMVGYSALDDEFSMRG